MELLTIAQYKERIVCGNKLILDNELTNILAKIIVQLIKLKVSLLVL
jgi:hypothetical protein